MKKSVYLVLACLLAVCAGTSLGATSVTVTDNSSYVFAGTNYTVYLGIEDALVLEANGRRKLLRVDECLETTVLESCLNSVSDDSASFIEVDLRAVLEPKHKLATSTIEQGEEVNVTVTHDKTGELDAENVFITLNIPAGLELDGESGTVGIDVGRITADKVTTYTLLAEENGTFTITGTLSYFDGNETIETALDTLTLKVDAPVTYSITYNNSTGVKPTTLKIDFVKKATGNFTISLTAAFPPETSIEGASSNVDTTDNTVTYRKYMNISKFNVNITYAFLNFPSAPVQLFLKVSNDSHDFNYAQDLSYELVEDTSPALAIGVDPMEENRTGTLKIIITGNRTGNLTIESTLLNRTMVAKNDTYEFPLAPAPKGTYAAKVSFTSINPYGGTHTARGTISITVDAVKTVANHTVQPATPATNQSTQAPTKPVQETLEPGKEATHAVPTIVWIGVAAALSMLAIIVFVAKRFSDPLTKIEHLMEQAQLLRLELQAKGKIDTKSKEYKALEKIERELTALQKKL